MNWPGLGKRDWDDSSSEFATDARPYEEDPRRWDLDPEAQRRVRRRRGVVHAILGTVFLAGTVAAIFGEKGYFDLRRLRAEERAYIKAVELQQDRVAEQQRAIHRLEFDSSSRERIARERLGLLREGEVDFVLGDSDDEDLF